jgi:hypothetical protein
MTWWKRLHEHVAAFFSIVLLLIDVIRASSNYPRASTPSHRASKCFVMLSNGSVQDACSIMVCLQRAQGCTHLPAVHGVERREAQ